MKAHRLPGKYAAIPESAPSFSKSAVFFQVRRNLRQQFLKVRRNCESVPQFPKVRRNLRKCTAIQSAPSLSKYAVFFPSARAGIPKKCAVFPNPAFPPLRHDRDTHTVCAAGTSQCAEGCCSVRREKGESKFKETENW